MSAITVLFIIAVIFPGAAAPGARRRCGGRPRCRSSSSSTRDSRPSATCCCCWKSPSCRWRAIWRCCCTPPGCLSSAGAWPSSRSGSAWLAAMGWLAILAALAITALFVRSPAAQTIHVGGELSPKLVAFVREHPEHFQRPLTTTWNAGPLLWEARPDFRVSIDDRFRFLRRRLRLPLRQHHQRLRRLGRQAGPGQPRRAAARSLSPHQPTPQVPPRVERGLPRRPRGRLLEELKANGMTEFRIG